MAIDDKTKTELEAAVFRRLVEHLRSRTDVQNIDLMNLAGFCRNCLSNWMKEEADAKGMAVSKDESREGRLWHAVRNLEGEISGCSQPRATRRDEEGLESLTIQRFALRKPRRHHEEIFSCGRAVDDRDVSLTQCPMILRVIWRKAPRGTTCGA